MCVLNKLQLNFFKDDSLSSECQEAKQKQQLAENRQTEHECHSSYIILSNILHDSCAEV